MTGLIYKLSGKVSPSKIYLTPEARRVLAQVNGSSSLSEIARQAGVSENDAVAITDSLWLAGILEVVYRTFVGQEA